MKIYIFYMVHLCLSKFFVTYLSTDHLILTVLSMIESMGMRTTVPGYSSRGESNPGRQITSPEP